MADKYHKLIEHLRICDAHKSCLTCPFLTADGRVEECRSMSRNAADALEELLSGHIFSGFSIVHDTTNPMQNLVVGGEIVATAGDNWRIADVLLDGWMRGENHDRAVVVFVRDGELRNE